MVIILAVIGGILFQQNSGTKTFDQAAVQDGVSRILTDDYGAQQVNRVSCPSGQEVVVGSTFLCDVDFDGRTTSVEIRVLDEDGTYSVSQP